MALLGRPLIPAYSAGLFEAESLPPLPTPVDVFGSALVSLNHSSTQTVRKSHSEKLSNSD